MSELRDIIERVPVAPVVQYEGRVVKTVLQQVLELPHESILWITGTRISSATAVHRTGATGWLTTRDAKNAGRYRGTSEISDFIRERLAAGASITVLRHGGSA